MVRRLKPSPRMYRSNGNLRMVRFVRRKLSLAREDREIRTFFDIFLLSKNIIGKKTTVLNLQDKFRLFFRHHRFTIDN